MEQGRLFGVVWRAMAGTTAAFILVLWLQPGGEWVSRILVNDIAQALSPAVAALLCFAAARRSPRGGWRRAWSLLGASALSWAAGQVIWCWYEVVLEVEAPFPSAADIGYLAAVPLAIAGVLSFPVRSALSRARLLVDGMIVTSALLEISWALVLGPTFRTATGGTVEELIALAYPAADTAVLVVLLLTLSRVPAGLRTPIWMVASGLAALAVADSFFAYLAVTGDYGSGTLADTGWFAGYLLLGLGAMRVVTNRGSVPPPLPDDEDRFRVFHLGLPYLSLLAAVSVILVRGLGGEAVSGLLLWNGLAAMALIVIRQLLVVSDNATLTRSLAHQATHDALTALPNRVMLVRRLAEAISALGHDPGTVSVLFVDLDRFKVINDSLGHEAGDQVLVTTAERLAAALPEDASVARFGGDEFVAWSRVEDAAAAVRLAERLATAIRGPIRAGAAEIFVTASIGVATTNERGATPEVLIRDADLAMYVAKERGRARVERFETALRARPLARLDLETALHRAIERDEFVVHFQPIVDLGTGDLAAVEALVRWDHPIRGLLEPQEFLDVAEDTGLVVPIGARVLDRACAAVVEMGHRLDGVTPTLMVNVSTRQLDQGDLPRLIRRTLAHHGLAPTALCLEVTEGVIAAETTLGTLLDLRAMGLTLAVDDFGTGYSSLGHLRRLPVGMLKIDKSLMRGLGTDAGATPIVAAITHMARALGMKVVAEGVETVEQLAELQALGCDLGQGYLLGRPGSVDAIVTRWGASSGVAGE